MARSLSLVLALLFVVIPDSQSQEPRIRTLGTGFSQGRVWLEWTRASRIGFVRGYLAGVHTGCRDACFTATNTKPSFGPVGPDSLSKCLGTCPRFSGSPEYYEARITAFFSTYKSDVGMPVDEVLRLLSDSENRSLDQIHELYVSSGRK